MLVFTPALCGGRDALAVLESALPWIDLLQVRVKPLGAPGGLTAPSSARETWDWCVRALDLLAAHPALDVPLIVNDRVDVACALRARGCAGVHLGQDDSPVDAARALLGDAALIGLSTHDRIQVEAARALPVDYLGFGPIHATRTKGYLEGLGASGCIAVQRACPLPLFPIGGIDGTNAHELAAIGRAAVGSAITAAHDPARAAQELRRALCGESTSSATNMASP
jgi:thiamine-phosphate pyrophosphorylase